MNQKVCAAINEQINSEFMSPNIAFVGRSAKKRHPDPRNGSKYRQNPFGTSGIILGNNFRLLPAQRNKGALQTSF